MNYASWGYFSTHVIEMISSNLIIGCRDWHARGDICLSCIGIKNGHHALQFRAAPLGGSEYQEVSRRETGALNGNKSEWCILSSSTGAEW